MSGWTRAGRRPRSTRDGRGRRSVLAVLVAIGLVLMAGACGTDAQTLRPYTPAEGVNVDVGNEADQEGVVQVRGLMIISRTQGSGVLSATMVTLGRDQLTAVSGNAIKSDGSPGAPLTVQLPPNSVSFANGAQIVLTDIASIGVFSPDLAPGLTANMTLQFANAGEITLLVPVTNGGEPQYASITPPPPPAAGT